ncbi:hypothetical protein B0H16DRAFT_1687802 [Mycena metata]|uniref:Uncharacterized protein n=1 Tax=Mycena metata TaxID=1033252 RepID=A0AAD7NJP1_9AGAR|nr:hypothetical protein B0H16DRAFT_1687802 [Mycena metata]
MPLNVLFHLNPIFLAKNVAPICVKTTLAHLWAQFKQDQVHSSELKKSVGSLMCAGGIADQAYLPLQLLHWKGGEKETVGDSHSYASLFPLLPPLYLYKCLLLKLRLPTAVPVFTGVTGSVARITAISELPRQAIVSHVTDLCVGIWVTADAVHLAVLSDRINTLLFLPLQCTSRYTINSIQTILEETLLLFAEDRSGWLIEYTGRKRYDCMEDNFYYTGVVIGPQAWQAKVELRRVEGFLYDHEHWDTVVVDCGDGKEERTKAVTHYGGKGAPFFCWERPYLYFKDWLRHSCPSIALWDDVVFAEQFFRLIDSDHGALYLSSCSCPQNGGYGMNTATGG